MPEISVIVPVYKVEPYIHRCVDSILAQTFTDFELILVDDGSPDNCGAICDEYATKDDRIRVFHQENQGQAAARNHALDWVFAHSDSEYISFVDSDDWVHPRYLELLREGIERYQANICQCDHLETDGTDEAPAVVGRFSNVTAEEQYVSHYSAFMWDKLFARSCWEGMRFPEGQIYEDVAIWYKILFKEERVVLVEDALYYYFVNPESTVRKDWTPKCLSRIRAWNNQLDFFEEIQNEKVLRYAVEYYCRISVDELNSIRISDKLNSYTRFKYSRFVLRGLRKKLSKYDSFLAEKAYYSWYYEVSHPFKSRLLSRWKQLWEV